MKRAVLANIGVWEHWIIKMIGIIAEDQSDYDVIRIIANKVAATPLSFRKSLAKGCGKIMSRCNYLAKDLKRRGCTHLIIVRDADTIQTNKLKKDIAKRLNPSPISPYIIVIAKEEIEAWLLSDINAIHSFYGNSKRNKLAKIQSPEQISDAKNYLKNIIKRTYKKVYIPTKHNESIAQNITIRTLENNSASSKELTDFIATHFS